MKWVASRLAPASLMLVTICASSSLRADVVTLRMAAIAPDGTAWARELKALGRDVEASTHGSVRMKWYLGGIAGDERTALERVRKGQLDGLAGAMFCEQLAPSLQVMRIVALFNDRDEGDRILNRLLPTAQREMEQHGFVMLGGIGNFGAEIIFSREPVRTMADLRKTRLWTWSLDALLVNELPAMGVRAVALPIEAAAAAYDARQIDGFIAIPTAGLAFRWSAQARYFTELSATILPGCLVVSQHALDPLGTEQQQIVQGASAKFMARFGDVGQAQDEALLTSLFDRQGLQHAPLSAQFRAELRESARRAREETGSGLLLKGGVDPALLSTVLTWLADLRVDRTSERTAPTTNGGTRGSPETRTGGGAKPAGAQP
ncbi:MAG TPA: TRAP transporter substrate-binding protein DctP, partial [Polyangia bacterium]